MKKDKYLRVQEILKEKGINQKELAKHLDMREESFSLSLKNETLNVEKLSKISKYLDVQLSDLFEKEENSITCPNCGKRFVMEDSHIPDHKNIRGKEYYK